MSNIPSPHMEIDFQKIFAAMSVPYLIFLPEPHFPIIAASDAYLEATMTKRDEIMGKPMFDVFPDNPDDINATGVRNLRISLERVLKDKVSDSMAVQKYDVLRPPSAGGGFEEKYWSPINTPVFNEHHELLYIIHKVDDMTDFIRLKKKGQEQSQLTLDLQTKVEKAESEVLTRAQEIQNFNKKLQDTHSELEKMYQRVKEVDVIKTQFFANVSHELRTPLTLILGPVKNILNDLELSDRHRKDLEIVNRNARTLLMHVNDLLDVAKIEAGKMTLYYSELNLAKLVRLTVAHFESALVSKGIHLLEEIPESLTAQVDEEKIQQIIMNLLSNALKFVPSNGQVKCSVTLSSRENFVKIIIADTGIGIPAKLRRVIFDRFRQAEGSSTRTVGGTGLGLAIVKDLVELHKGTIEVAETPGGGASFIIEIPLKACPDQEIHKSTLFNQKADLYLQNVEERIQTSLPYQTSSPPSLKLTSVGPVATSLAQKKVGENNPLILIVDDHSDMREYIASTLAHDYQIATAENGWEGWKKIQELRPHLIITDIMMPKMSGDQMLEEIRRHSDYDQIPVIVLTAKSDDEFKVKTLRNGCQDFVNKPFSAEELLLRVKNLILVGKVRNLLSRELQIKSHDILILSQQLAHRNRELKLACENMQQAKEQAEKANKTKSQFLTLVSHELNTPLTSMLLTLSLVAKKGILPSNERSFQRVINSTHRLKELIESMLNYTMISSGKIDLNINQLDLKNLVKNVIKEIEPLSNTKQLSIVIEFPNEFPLIETDAKLISMVISNLFINSLKYTEKGYVKLTADCESDFFTLAISDTGQGIDQENQKTIFEPFKPLTPIENKSIPGVGLGLSLVKEIVQTMGGIISLESELGKGTTFTVRLPLTQKISA